MRFGLLAFALAALGSAACGPVRHHHVRPDFDQQDRTGTVRLALVVSPLPAQSEAIGELFAAISREYVNDKRDYIVKSAEAAADPGNADDACVEGIEGVLRVQPWASPRGEGVDTGANAWIQRCRDGQIVWSAGAGGHWRSDDPQLDATTDHYTAAHGAEVRPYVAPAFRLLRGLFDTLPRPALPDEAAELEKIEAVSQ